MGNNRSANEGISKYKLLSAYGGPGSLIHTQYGGVIISCIEEWGFLKRIIELNNKAIDRGKNDIERIKYVHEESNDKENGSISLSNDVRLLESLKLEKNLINLEFLVLIPSIDIAVHNNEIKNLGYNLAINSTYMPKVFSDKNNNYNSYSYWYDKWINNINNNDKFGIKFHPPSYNTKEGLKKYLKQDNIILICEHGHISDFPWSKFLRWRNENPQEIYNENSVNLFNSQNCCNNPQIRISSNSGNSSGYESKWLKCYNCEQGVSLKGLLSCKIKCPGHKPWESITEQNQNYPYSGNNNSRNNNPPQENCTCKNPMKVGLTTGNNIYYSNNKTSIYLHNELFESESRLKIIDLEKKKEKAYRDEEYDLLIELQEQIKELKLQIETDEESVEENNVVKYKYDEFLAFHKDENLLSKHPKDLKVKIVTENLNDETKVFFNRVLRIDNMKITSAQLDFTRVFPSDSDTENSNPKNIFRSKSEDVLAYPVVENYGEGIFFSFNESLFDDFSKDNLIVDSFQAGLNQLKNEANTFNKNAINYACNLNWELYLVHTFSHLIMRELEFRCGYPTSSLSERLYISNQEETKMYGCLIYTAEGEAGSMGGLIAQTRSSNLNNLIISAINRATICNSDPLCWESNGQGLFDLNFASCFSCSLVSETSCEHRNLYLDRKLLVDIANGFFKKLIK